MGGLGAPCYLHLLPGAVLEIPEPRQEPSSHVLDAGKGRQVAWGSVRCGGNGVGREAGRRAGQ